MATASRLKERSGKFKARKVRVIDGKASGDAKTFDLLRRNNKLQREFMLKKWSV
jgi:hypothetical protein